MFHLGKFVSGPVQSLKLINISRYINILHIIIYLLTFAACLNTVLSSFDFHIDIYPPLPASSIHFNLNIRLWKNLILSKYLYYKSDDNVRFLFFLTGFFDRMRYPLISFITTIWLSHDLIHILKNYNKCHILMQWHFKD